MGLFDWLRGKDAPQSGLMPLTDEQYQALFVRLLQDVADGRGAERLRLCLGDRFTDPQFLVWLRGYGERLLASPDRGWARLLVRLGEVGCGEIGEVAQELGLRVLAAIPSVDEEVSPSVSLGGVISSVAVDEGVIPPAPLDKGGVLVDDDFEGFYRQGLAELEAGNYERALMFFDRAIAINENQAEVWTKRAVVLQNLNQIGKAIEANQRAIALIKGNQLLATNNFLSSSTQSKVEFLPSIPEPVINLDEAEKWFAQGNSLYFEGRYQEAIASFDKALQIKPDDHQAWYNRGIALGNLGRTEEAIASYDKALQFKPDLHEAWLNRGIALGNLGRTEEAIASYDKALQFKPDLHEAWYNRGVALDGLGRYEEAIASCDQALQIKPDLHEAWYSRGVALGNLGRYEEAIASYEQALQIKPDLHEAWNNRGNALRNLGRYEEAIASYDNALKFKPDMHETWNNRGIALDGLGRLEEAIASYDGALTFSQGKNWQAWANRGIAAYQATDSRGQKTLLPYRLPLEMYHPDLDLRGYEGALACYREGLKYVQRQSDPEGWGQLHRRTGLRHYKHGRSQPNPYPFWRKAVPCYHNALETLTATPPLATAHLETLQEFIRVLTALGETEQAKGLLRQGTDFLARILADKSETERKRLEQKFRYGFNELTVVLLVQSGDYRTALEVAEADKNAFLRQGLLNKSSDASPDYAQMQRFLATNAHTALIYWHLSANAVTTFILTPDQPEPLTLTSDLSQRLQLENWINDWKNTYPTDKTKANKPPLSRGAGGIEPPNETEEIKPPNETDHSNQPSQSSTPPFLRGAGGIEPPNETEGTTWRDRLAENLQTLHTLLQIDQIEQTLSKNPQINRLILLPHRDLHLFPLDSLFTTPYTISYLPSIQVGINLLNHPENPENRLLSLENPDSSQANEDGTIARFPSLTAAEAESELICRLYAHPTRRDKQQVTLSETEYQLKQAHNLFHFTGHGYYDFNQPMNSALALSQTDRLTLNEIIQLDLSSYDLACLCACETAIAGNQTITTEYIGIVSAFIYAGVAKVVSTLWIVESVASALLMVEFHRRRLTGLPTSQALQQAKIWLRTATPRDLEDWYQRTIDDLPLDHSLRPWLCDRLDEIATMEPGKCPYQNPYYWAAFTLTGL